jgi:hypothetical protein
VGFMCTVMGEKGEMITCVEITLFGMKVVCAIFSSTL